MNITVNGKEYPLQWGMGAIRRYCDTMGCDIDGLTMIEDARNTLQFTKALTTFILSALKNGCEAQNIDHSHINYGHIETAIDEMEQEKLKSIIEDWGQSRIMGRTVAEYLYGLIDPAENNESKKNSLLGVS